MKYFVKFLVVTFFFLQCTYASAEQKIVYLDMTFVLNKSTAGEGAQIFLKKTFEENQKKLVIQENIDPILKTYSKENNVTLVIDKKFILSGSADLDITKIIVEKLNKELPSLNLQ